MSEYLTTMGPAVANHLWQSTALVAAAWVVTLALRRNQARVRHAVWLVASVKFLVPFALLVAAGNLLPHPKQTVAPVVYSAMDEVEEPFAVDAPAVDPTLATMRPSRRWGTRVEEMLPAGLAVMWVLGAGVVLVVWASRWRAVRRVLRKAEIAGEGREWEILTRCKVHGSRFRSAIELRLSAERMEPGIFGVWRPVLVWPRELSARLDDAQIEAVMAHELMHVRRRDNLTAALHMLVEAAFWFHPAVWWMERRMVKERERACDEAVVAMGGDAETYAESLLKTVRFCIESPLTCVAGVTGGELKQRVMAIVTGRALLRMTWPKKLLLAAAAVCAVGAPVVFGVVLMIPMYGQILHASGPLPSFEVATIRPLDQMHFMAPPGGAGPRVAPNGEPIISQQEIRVSNAPPPAASNMVNETMTAKMLIVHAYNLPAFSKAQIVGGPDWADQTMYQIKAKIDDAEYAAMQGMPQEQQVQQVHLMEQSLLADRFKLKVHFETREVPVYALQVARGGPKLTPAKVDSVPAESAAGARGTQSADLTITGKGDGFELKGRRASPGQLMMLLQQQPELGNRMVIDKTGLDGKYDMTLDWIRAGAATVDAGAAAADAAPSLFTAMKEQLGLELVETKGPVEVIVIDQIEKPTVDGAEVTQPTLSPKGDKDGAPAQPLRVGTLTQLAPANSALAQNGDKGAAAAMVPVAQVQKANGQAQGAQNAVSGCPDAALFAAYDVVSVRPAHLAAPRGLRDLPDGIDGSATVEALVRSFYLYPSGVVTANGANEDMITGLPEWAKNDYFSIQTKMSPEQVVMFAKLNIDQQRACQRSMVQAMLADKFAFKMHPQPRQVPAYELVVAKSGPKIQQATGPDRAMSITPHSAEGGYELTLQAYSMPMKNLANLLAISYWGVGRNVADKTGLVGKYSFVLTFAPPRTTGGAPANVAPDDAEPAILNALEDQLGLRLQKTTATYDAVVIDHVERPSEN